MGIIKEFDEPSIIYIRSVQNYGGLAVCRAEAAIVIGFNRVTRRYNAKTIKGGKTYRLTEKQLQKNARFPLELM